MKDIRKPLQVGAPDPELRNSPVFDEADADLLSYDAELESGVCYLNDHRFALGDYVCSGNELLRCAGRGVWVRQGDCVKS
ncbi:MAG: hypothetical protein B0D96_11275 [Candidatus Sedimenticola endophacoides]|uniref:DUF1496 domain-containing protein n=1 Tax=Candidatus Sedimenticola endophacoides TaxID=2548426 RepID=A0A657Q177_9GAMM|nr:MAG: hypothetical protein B0D94_10360 [Candidatus Sedimenticola endophacoides]OQX33635.1 MAG: hypothetical protein B0D96_11275 [Candidatus Sedimenticola endophacoides]OQX40022.1 MAG: hypothetical protein B0D89_09235 [Candidatus Sedimenticola endophacoides]OQX46545.1 MAG: hypothetical protein B0D85_03515 [Candidatus Sedimenticola endophacoides]OQX46832.1 MAG: hypothetical protein B0D86_00995 [Candidatus Sedimenticola endophacoides]